MKSKLITISIAFVLICAAGILPALSEAGAGNIDALRARILETARKYLGARYNYGGRGADGFDCSGFVQFVYRENGINLARSTPDQFEQGKKIELSEAHPGDLVFFRIYGGRISHVGIFIEKSTFIHAPSKGKYVSYADMNLEYWKKTFAGAVSYIGVSPGNTR